MRKQKRKTKEERIKGVKALEKRAPAASNAFEHERLLHELQVHQVELETQNRELREAQQLLEVSRDRYADLYDFAPVGYVSFDDKGVIREINLTAAGMLGVERTRLVGVPFHLHVAREDLARFRGHLAELSDAEKRVVTELQLTRKGGGVLSVVMQSVLVYDAERKGYQCRTALTDITARQRAEDALRQSHERLEKVLEVETVGVMFWDLNTGCMTDANDAFLKLMGYSRREVEAGELTWQKLTPPEYVEASLAEIRKFRVTGRVGPYEKEYFRKDGTRQWLIFAGSSLGDNACVEFCVDISARKNAEAELQRAHDQLVSVNAILKRSKENLANAQRVAQIGSYEFDVPGAKRLNWSVETFCILGLDSTQPALSLEEYLSRIVHPDDRGRVREGKERLMNEGTRYDLQYRIQRPDGSIRHVHSVAEAVRGADNSVIKVSGVLQDITERKSLEREVLEISEREQSRIGQDLHDGLCQHLAGIEFRLLGLKQKLEGKSSKQAAETAEVAKLVRQGMEQTRTLARGLSPVITVADGLMSALQELATITEQAFRTACSFNCPTPVLLHDNAVGTHLYRIAQEAIQNAIRHGKAKFIVINLFMQNDRIVLAVKDDGVGFPKKPRKHNGMGLRVMQYRAGMVGGSLVVQHEPDGGTSVVCSLRAKRARAANRLA